MNDEPPLPSLEQLDEKLRAAEAKRRKTKAGPDDGGQGLAFAMRIGVEIVAALIVGVGIGLLLDYWLGTKPWFFLLFFVLGAAYLSPVTIVMVMALSMLTPIFFILLKAPTAKGREIMDQIEGFKRYLSVAEKHRLDAFHPPEKTPELFEKFLPYAIALEVENKWSEQFDDVLKAASATTEGTSQGYHPVWYHGSHWNRFGAAGFAGAVGGAMASSIASAATAPGSSSGAGGGGFSGGGGGGGGGGGW